jgi:hypothetical protein
MSMFRRDDSSLETHIDERFKFAHHLFVDYLWMKYSQLKSRGNHLKISSSNRLGNGASFLF